MNDYYCQHGASPHIAMSSNIRRNKSCWIQIVGCIQQNNAQMKRTKNQILNPRNRIQDYQTKTESEPHHHPTLSSWNKKKTDKIRDKKTHRRIPTRKTTCWRPRSMNFRKTRTWQLAWNSSRWEVVLLNFGKDNHNNGTSARDLTLKQPIVKEVVWSSEPLIAPPSTKPTWWPIMFALEGEERRVTEVEAFFPIELLEQNSYREKVNVFPWTNKNSKIYSIYLYYI